MSCIRWREFILSGIAVAMLFGVLSGIGLAKIELQFMDWNYTPGPYKDWMDKLIAEFEKQNPGVTIKMSTANVLDYQTKLMVTCAAGSGPDIFRTHPLYTPTVITEQFALDLKPYLVREKEVYLEDYFPGMLDAVTLDNKIVGLPYFGSLTDIWAFNRDLFNDAGLVEPIDLYEDGKWTWNDFANAAQKLTKRGPDGKATQVGLAILNSGRGMLRSFGADYFDKANSKCTLDSPQAIAVFEFIANLYKLKVMPTPEDWSALFPKAAYGFGAGIFESGKVGLYGIGTWYISTFRNAEYFGEWDIVPPPSGPAGRFAGVTVPTINVNRTSKHVDLAWKFVKLLTNRANDAALSNMGFQQPQRRPNYEEWLKMPPPPKHLRYVVEALKFAIPREPRVVNWDKMVAKLGEYENYVKQMKMSPQEAAQKLTKELDLILNKK